MRVVLCYFRVLFFYSLKILELLNRDFRTLVEGVGVRDCDLSWGGCSCRGDYFEEEIGGSLGMGDCVVLGRGWII